MVINSVHLSSFVIGRGNIKKEGLSQKCKGIQVSTPLPTHNDRRPRGEKSHDAEVAILRR